jgi:MFS family permease
MSLLTPEHRARNLTLFAAFLGWMFDGLEMGIFVLVARPALQSMASSAEGLDEAFIGHWLGIMTALFLVGAAVGGVFFGWLGDRVGRMRAMTFSILTYSIFTALTFFAHQPWQLGALRFISAMGMGGEWSLGVALVMEIWPSQHRPWLAGVIGAANNVGSCLLAVLGMFFYVTQSSWRWIVLVGAVPAMLTFLLRLFVPESKPWQQAARDKPIKPMKEIVELGLVGRLGLATLLAAVALVGTWGTVQWIPSWADQLTGGQMPQAKAYTQALSALGAAVGCVVGSLSGYKLARRPAYFLFCICSLVSCGLLFRTMNSFGPAFLGLTFSVGVLTGTFYGWLPLYLPELFPTRVRATAQGIAFNSARVLAAVGALQMGALMRQFDGSYARAGAIISLVYLVGLGLIWFGPETKGRPLPA